MQLISKYHKGFRFLLCVIDTYGIHAWVFPLKDKKDITITNAFQKNLGESNLKPNKIWVDKQSEFYNRSTESSLLIQIQTHIKKMKINFKKQYIKK